MTKLIDRIDESKVKKRREKQISSSTEQNTHAHERTHERSCL